MGNEKEFLYLTQVYSELPASYESLESQNSEVLFVSYGKRSQDERSIYLPDSSWTSGRNELVRAARARPERFRAYFFLDEDITFKEGGFREFEAAFARHGPAIATPRLIHSDGGPYQPRGGEDLNLEVQPVYRFDGAFNAFHSDVFWDDAIFPYVSKFDRLSWWYSQLITIQLSRVFYRNSVLQFNRLQVQETQTADYPRSGRFNLIDSWIQSTLLNNLARGDYVPYLEASSRPDYLRSFTAAAPSSLQTYRVSEATKRQHLRRRVASLDDKIPLSLRLKSVSRPRLKAALVSAARKFTSSAKK